MCKSNLWVAVAALVGAGLVNLNVLLPGPAWHLGPSVALAEDIKVVMPDEAKGFHGTILGKVYKMGDNGQFHISVVKVMSATGIKISAAALTDIWKDKYQWCAPDGKSPPGKFAEGDMVVLTCRQNEMHLRYTKVVPLLDPATLTQATTALDQVDAAVQSKDLPAAVKAMAKVPSDASLDPKLGERMTAAQKAISDVSDEVLAQVDPLIADKKFTEAAAKLKDLADALAGTPAGNKAKEKLATLLADPAVKEQFEAARKAQETAKKTEQATAALTAAQKLKADKKDELAYPRFKEIVAQYPNTPEAATAAQEVAAYEQDPAFVQKINNDAAAGKAKAMMSLADNYRSNGLQDMARKKYQEIIYQFPGTQWAEQAQKQLGEISP